MKIVKVVPRLDNKVYVYDDDGTIYLYNAQKLVDRFDQLKNKDFFINRCTILNNSLAWDVEGNGNDEKCIDVAPESILASPKVNI